MRQRRPTIERALRPQFLRLVIAWYVALMVIVWGVLLAQWSGPQVTPDQLGRDFMAFYTGGTQLKQGAAHDLYNLAQQQLVQQQLVQHPTGLSGFINPPQWAFVQVPLAYLPYRLAFMVWTGGMLACFVLAITLLRPALPVLRQQWSWAMATALAFPGVYYAISAGQNTGLSLLLHVAVLGSLRRGHDVVAGLLLALGCYKPQLFLPVLALLCLARRWPAVGSALLGLALIGVLDWWLVGLGGLQNWLSLLTSPIWRFEEQRQAGKLFSWQPFWLLLLGPTALATMCGWLAAAFTAALTARLWLRHSSDITLCYALAVIAIVLIVPHLAVYDVALLILPGLVIIDRVSGRAADRRGYGQWLKGLIALLYVVLLFYEQVSYTHVQIAVPLLMAILVLAAVELTARVADDAPGTAAGATG